MKKKSQDHLFIHSEVKVKLLGAYLQRYFNIMSNTPFVNTVHYYDMFSGPGIYENGGEGSPLIILRELKEAHFRAKSRKTDLSSKYKCLFNDKDLKKIETLCKNIKEAKIHYPEMGTLDYCTEDYKKLCPEVVKQLKSLPKDEKAFVFIDPYGYKDVRFSEIRDLLSSKKSEVLLFLPTHFMFRFSENGTPESLHNFINDVVPEDQWPKSETGLDFVENLKQAFQRNLGDDFFVDSFIISRDKNQFFCLFFFTSHIYGFDRMLDAKWEIDAEDGRGWKFNAASSNLFSQVINGPNTSKFEKELKAYLKERRSNKDLYVFTLQKGHLTSHAVQILKKWQDDGILVATLPDGKAARKSAFYIGWESYKNNQEVKAYFSTK
ncbi:three-Cys-motif partner protein TcmP [Sphingobacterium sp. DN00404]|uniref:Three-Cys-motif partner protein TcmP n=1 Tax=Sphingobacterium micropteri TaxID=2763501 RepID=A0ABR7YK37_9SPHI|nr:three-Cys-motif partner protein TcmP [Sphingobacterium micropteri]MBD1431596.1 three-Cys-motif partner protein TcmP [Sphingobacterium micropteri]